MNKQDRPEGFTRSLSLYWGWRTQRLLTARSTQQREEEPPPPAGDDDAAAAAPSSSSSPSRQQAHARGRFAADAATLQCEHWLEMADGEKHRYGSNLLPYFLWWWRRQGRGSGEEEEEEEGDGEEGDDGDNAPAPPPRRLPSLPPRDGSLSALARDAAQRDAAARRFFAFLDGTPEGAALDIGGGGTSGAGPPRAKLERERVRYLTAQERAELEVGVDGQGRLVYKRSGSPVHTRGGEQGRQQERRVVASAVAGAAAAAAGEGEGEEKEDKKEAPGPSGGDGAGRGRDDDDDDDDDNGVARALVPFLSAEAAAPGEEDEDGGDEPGGGGGGGGGIAPAASAAADENAAAATNKPCKWIWVLDRQRRFYVHAKRRGAFHHSSFLEGGEVLSAGGVDADGGVVLRLTADSGHYRPSLDNFMATVSLLRDMGADLSRAVLSAKHLAAPEEVLLLQLPLPPAAVAGAEAEEAVPTTAAIPLASASARAPSLGALGAARFANSVLLESAVEAALAAAAERGR